MDRATGRGPIVPQQRAPAAATTRWTHAGAAHISHLVRQAAEPGATSREAAAPRWSAVIARAPVGGSGGHGKGPWPLALQPRRPDTRAGVPAPDERAARGSAEGATRLKTRRRARFHRALLSGIRALRRGIESAGGVRKPGAPGAGWSQGTGRAPRNRSGGAARLPHGRGAKGPAPGADAPASAARPRQRPDARGPARPNPERGAGARTPHVAASGKSLDRIQGQRPAAAHQRSSSSGACIAWDGEGHQRPAATSDQRSRPDGTAGQVLAAGASAPRTPQLSARAVESGAGRRDPRHGAARGGLRRPLTESS
jgi:hypothetical protein